jgi:hypothetical protein
MPSDIQLNAADLNPAPKDAAYWPGLSTDRNVCGNPPTGCRSDAIVARDTLEICARFAPVATAELWLSRGASLGRQLKRMSGWLSHHQSGTARSH